MAERKLIAKVKKDELLPGARMRLDYPPFGILLVNLAGVPYAVDDTCNHAGESLSKGDMEGCRVVCPAHGYIFDVRTGHLLEPAGLCDNQRTFEVTAEADHFAVYDNVLELFGPG